MFLAIAGVICLEHRLSVLTPLVGALYTVRLAGTAHHTIINDHSKLSEYPEIWGV